MQRAWLLPLYPILAARGAELQMIPAIARTAFCVLICWVGVIPCYSLFHQASSLHSTLPFLLLCTRHSWIFMSTSHHPFRLLSLAQGLFQFAQCSFFYQCWGLAGELEADVTLPPLGSCWDVEAFKGLAQKFSHHKEQTQVQGTWLSQGERKMEISSAAAKFWLWFYFYFIKWVKLISPPSALIKLSHPALKSPVLIESL